MYKQLKCKKSSRKKYRSKRSIIMRPGDTRMCSREWAPFSIATVLNAGIVAGVVAGMTTTVFAQSPPPPPSPAATAHVVRVRMGYSCGMCGGLFYHSSSTTVEPSFLLWQGMYSSNPKKLPNRKTKVAITKQDWKNLLHSIDANALQALPQQGCRSCRDLPESWVVVEYSDGSKIAVNYGPSEIPKPVAAIRFPAVSIPMGL
jgi:hypothetical protein